MRAADLFGSQKELKDGFRVGDSDAGFRRKKQPCFDGAF